jgi:uncharacterized protein YkwD
VATLLLALPSTAGAATAQHRHGTIHVRHQRIHKPAHKRHRHKHSRHHVRKHRRHAHRRHAHTRHKHKRHTHKRTVPYANQTRPALVSGNCPGATLTPNPDNLESVRAATLCLVNEERARFGEPALLPSNPLASAAAEHSRDMDARDYFEHVSPGGQTLLMRVRSSGFVPNGHVGYTLGENIAWGTLWLASPRSIVKAWMASPGHRANILDRSFRYTGIGIDTALAHSMSGGQAGGMYTQDFGTIFSH